MLEIAIDIGGTFTDIVCLQDQQRLCLTKVPTTPYDLVQEVHVGPQSAGADPGPACYGRGGTVPTVTDASVVLGYLNPHYFAGGDLTLQVDQAHQVVRDMAARLHMTPEALAAGMHHILNACMADEIRLVSVRRGYDPRQFALVPLGGAGPVHGGRLAAMLSIPTTVVPTAPGVLSAFGLLVANIEHDQSRTFAVKAAEVDVERIVQVLAELDLLGQEKMQRDHVPPELVHVNHAADLRYVGQSYELEVPLPKSWTPAVERRLSPPFMRHTSRSMGTAAPLMRSSLSTCAVCTALRCRVHSLLCRHPVAAWRQRAKACVRRILTNTRRIVTRSSISATFYLWGHSLMARRSSSSRTPPQWSIPALPVG